MCDMDGESARVWVETPRRARKAHVCCECFAPIPVGHSYVQINGVYSDFASTDRRHVACHELWEDVASKACGHPGYSLVGGLDAEISELDHALAPLLPDELVAACNERDEDLPNPFREAFDLIEASYRAMEASR